MTLHLCTELWACVHPPPPAPTMTSASPRWMMRKASPSAWPPVAQAVEGAWLGPCSPYLQRGPAATQAAGALPERRLTRAPAIRQARQLPPTISLTPRLQASCAPRPSRLPARTVC